jgi:CheY-like chemotaxis protein
MHSQPLGRSTRRGGCLCICRYRERRSPPTIFMERVRTIHVTLTVSPIRDAEGDLIGASRIGPDITLQKLMEAERLEADRRKDEFLAMLAHELRNPLASINNAIQIFGKFESEEELEWAREVVLRHVKHLGRLIDDLLDVSRITRGKISLRNVELHGGSVTARSEGAGKRSEFTVRLPSREHRDALATEPKKGLSRVASPSSRVLVVDDNVDTAVGVSKLLKLLEHDVRIAHDGRTAVEVARSHHPEVVQVPRPRAA